MQGNASVISPTCVGDATSNKLSGCKADALCCKAASKAAFPRPQALMVENAVIATGGMLFTVSIRYISQL
jgi:hypothetical protein